MKRREGKIKRKRWKREREREHEQKEEDKEEDEKEEDREQELFEEDKEQEKKEEDTDVDENEEDREEYFEEEDSEHEMKVDEKEEEIEQNMIKEEKDEEKRSVEKVVEMRVDEKEKEKENRSTEKVMEMRVDEKEKEEEKRSAEKVVEMRVDEKEKEEEKRSAEKVVEMRVEEKDLLQVYQKKSKKVVSKGTRGPSTGIRTRSQLVRTPFTEEKKKVTHPDIITISHHKEDDRKKIRYYCKHGECTWDFQKNRKIKKNEEALMKLLNEGIPVVDDFSIRLVDSKRIFVHNFRISQHVATKLTLEENRWVSEFCNQKAHQSCIVVNTSNSSIDSLELLNLLRGGRIDDHVMEALIDRINTWLDRPEIAPMSHNYGVVSVFFYKHVVVRKNTLLIPLVPQDHWHVAEVRLDDDVIKHYSSATHDPWLKPVNKVIGFMDHMMSDFDLDNVWRKFRYEDVP
ncbi:DNA ligase 1-like [Asparagus officinalis]|uniref:DNA ligase 1-like n=1 Tax=Asparagus officinalis TaxID=4686 RepID=UPI00098E8386|nr:DNA ligase 1-like [Asparagus officinalis]